MKPLYSSDDSAKQFARNHPAITSHRYKSPWIFTAHPNRDAQPSATATKPSGLISSIAQTCPSNHTAAARDGHANCPACGVDIRQTL